MNSWFGKWISALLPTDKDQSLSLTPHDKLIGTYYLFREPYDSNVRYVEPKRPNGMRSSYLLYPQEIKRTMLRVLGLKEHVVDKIIDVVWDLRRVAFTVPDGRFWVMKTKEEDQIYVDARITFG
jgi:hypothetical protein